MEKQSTNYYDIKQYRLDPGMLKRFLDTQERNVLQFTSEMSISCDGDKVAKETALAYAKFTAEDAGRR